MNLYCMNGISCGNKACKFLSAHFITFKTLDERTTKPPLSRHFKKQHELSHAVSTKSSRHVIHLHYGRSFLTTYPPIYEQTFST